MEKPNHSVSKEAAADVVIAIVRTPAAGSLEKLEQKTFTVQGGPAHNGVQQFLVPILLVDDPDPFWVSQSWVQVTPPPFTHWVR